MNFFTKYRVVTWILAGILAVALSALGTIIYQTWKETKAIEEIPACISSCMMLTSVLEFNASQNENLEKILDRFSDTSAALVSSLREHRMALMNELQKEHPDSLRIRILTGEIGSAQAMLTSLAASQYLQIRKICDSSQQLKLSDFYCDMFGCPRVEMRKGQGQHRHRKGKK
ncbi:MAG: periplasmic heavy metal sensor [Bacteroidales bacterium]|nr:periplasmic heavy metal sensor [Bacteroidales bacterium]